MSRDPIQIKGWQRLNARTTTSGFITADDVAALSVIGVRHVINLALVDSPGALADEGDLLAAQGMAYTHIPVPFSDPTEAHYAAFCAALAGGTQPVHVHCIMNWRVSAFFYRLHCERGMPEAEARALMEQQWSPENSDNADAPAWAAFIAR
jgi:protein tyrosine phosphatase (PTP) superfamily phosphohydrolase (DUF442 family)